MAVIVGKTRRAGATAAVAVVSVVGLFAVPAAQASQSGQPAARTTDHLIVPRPGLTTHMRVAPIFGRSLRGLGRSLWGRDALGRGGLPRIARTDPFTSGSWSVQPTPNPASVRNGALAADSCSAPGACTAVGTYVNAAGAVAPLTERLVGGSWRVQATPAVAGAVDTILAGVSCTSRRACMAVGYYYNRAGDVIPLTEQWNGSRWKIKTAPRPADPASGFFAVSCTSASACTAVGTTDNSQTTMLPLADRWNGTKWTMQATPVPATQVSNELFGVSCSAANACTAVGLYVGILGATSPLAMSWNGSWTTQTAALPSGAENTELTAVSCTAAKACTAVGIYETSSLPAVSLAERWNGTNWVVQTVPNPAKLMFSELLGVSCTGAKACTADGAYQSTGPVLSLAETWNGSKWGIKPNPNPAHTNNDGFNALSCAKASACAAVGSYFTAATIEQLTMAQTWNGATWKLQTSANSVGANPSQLSSDTCVTPRDCVAVGSYSKTATVGVTLAEVWNGSRWRISPTPNPKGEDNSSFAAVSCASAHACETVGAASKGINPPIALAEAFNGTKWTVQKIPNPAKNLGVLLNSVSCSSAKACTAVGFYDTKALSIAIAERWNGSSWRIQALPSVAKTNTSLLGVWCTSARACFAVGYLVKGNSDAKPLAESWNGKSWRIQHVPLPSATPGGLFSSVSCTSAKACTATGASFATNGEPLAERWNGIKWSVQKTVAPPDFQESVSEIGLNSVSCSSALACTAVSTYNPNNFSATFGEAWRGIKWRLQTTAVPAVTTETSLGGLSCVTPKCVAVGINSGLAELPVTLAESEPS